MAFVRTEWIGVTAYTSLTTCQQESDQEQVVIVEEFDARGLLQPGFKVAYIANGKVTLKLQFSHQRGNEPAAPWLLLDDGPLYLYCTTESIPTGANLVGALNQVFDYQVAGRIAIWTLLAHRSYQTWQYQGFWGAPIEPLFAHSGLMLDSLLPAKHLGRGVIMDGWGHRYCDPEQKEAIVRTLVYSVDLGGERRQLCLKSSNLRLVSKVQQAAPFTSFI